MCQVIYYFKEKFKCNSLILNVKIKPNIFSLYREYMCVHNLIITLKK